MHWKDGSYPLGRLWLDFVRGTYDAWLGLAILSLVFGVAAALVGFALQALVAVADLCVGRKPAHNMPRDFKMALFYPDGKPPEIVAYPASSLSPKWSRICQQMLDELGLVFQYNMGHTLSHFDVHLAGPMGRLLVHGRRCYAFSLVRGRGDDQDVATVRQFESMVAAACQAAHRTLSAETQAALHGLEKQPALLMFDYCDPEIDSDQRVAIGQLGVHLAAAYFDYCEDGQPSAPPNGGRGTRLPVRAPAAGRHR